MKYTSCYWINQGLNFKRRQLRFCWYEHLQGKGENVIFEGYNGELIDYERYFEIKNKYKELAKSGNFHPNCKNCIYLFENEWSDEDFVDHLTFNHWLNCNSNCVYCGQTLLPPEEKIQYYDVYPIIEDMKKNNILKSTPYSCIIFGGGEPTLLKEFDKLIDLFLNDGFHNIRVNSSGIKYSENLAEAIKNNAASLVISPDSGTKEMHEKIKRVKTYEILWNNISKYVKDTNYSDNVIIKYIIIPGLNDKKEEIDAFFDMVRKNKVRKVGLSVESDWYADNFPNFPQKIYDKIGYFMQKIKQHDLEYELMCEVKSLLKYEEN